MPPPKKQTHFTNKKFDWDALKLEFLTCNDTLNHFRLKKGISTNWFYTKAQQAHWEEDREKIRERALAKTQTKIVNGYAREWDNQIKLWKAVEGMAARIIERAMRIDDKTHEPKLLEASELSNLSNAIANALKHQKLIMGQPTEITDHTMSKEYWLALIDYTNDAVPEIPPEFKNKLEGPSST